MYFKVGDKVQIKVKTNAYNNIYANCTGKVIEVINESNKVLLDYSKSDIDTWFYDNDLDLIPNDNNKYTYFVSYSYDSGFGNLEYFTNNKIKNFDDILSIIEILKNKGRKDPVIICWQLFDD